MATSGDLKKVIYYLGRYLAELIIHKTSMKGKKSSGTEEVFEEFKISGKELLQKVKELIKEGNARRLTIKNEDGEVVLSMPLTFGVVGSLLAPFLAVIGGLAALLTSCTVVVERKTK